MARTFSHQRHHQNRKATPLTAVYRTPPPARESRGPFHKLADKVREYRQRITQVGPTTGTTDRPPAE